MRLRAIELRLVHLELVKPFRTSFGEETFKECVIARVETDGAEGWGECVASVDPGFSEEFNDGVWAVAREFLIPTLLDAGDVDAEAAASAMGVYRGNRMAKAMLETALLDAELRERDSALRSFLGGDRERVEVGVSVGIQERVAALVDEVRGYVDAGYRRIKLKIRPGFDVEPVEAVRAAFPDVLLSVDANAAYTPADTEVFRALDGFDLLMIEQPFHYEDLVMHAALQRALRTPLCLDESIRSAADARAALELGACQVVNIKPGRVGGYLEARRIHDVCRDAGVPVWCGGMFETGIGRAANLALASLPGFTLPGDISESRRYFVEDLTEPFTMAPDGTMAVPAGPGIGVAPIPARLEAVTIRAECVGKE